MTTYTAAWVGLALRGAPGAGAEVTRQVADHTAVRDLDRHARTLNTWAQINPGAESNPDYWKGYKLFAIDQLREPQGPL